ncbi:MAG: Fic family protein [Bacteroidota bacterium]|nr:Fic family protein [Bacteroidota bacterium]
MDKLAIELSKLPFIEDINALKKEVDSHRPIAKEVGDKVLQKLRLDWNYNSNAIEGNKLNYGETVAFLMHGITAKGKTLKDHLDIKGHNDAINFLLDIVKEKRDISESDIRSLHKMILVEEYDIDAITEDGQSTKKRIKLGIYKTSPNSVKTRTGEIHYYPSPEATPALMEELLDWYNECKQNIDVHPLILASLFHFKFVAIHPFDDGNGRLGRILMNLILMRHSYPPIVVKNEDKENYYGVLSQADSQQFIPLVEYMSNLLRHSLELYLRGIKGESIEEESDIIKEIELLKKSFDKKDIQRPSKSIEKVNVVFSNVIYPFFEIILNRTQTFDELFFTTKNEYLISFENDKDLKQIQNPKIDNIDMLVQSIKFPVESLKNLQSIECIKHYINFKEKNIKSVPKLSFSVRVNFTDSKYDIKLCDNYFKEDYWGVSYKDFYSNYYNEIPNINVLEELANKILRILLNKIKEAIEPKDLTKEDLDIF